MYFRLEFVAPLNTNFVLSGLRSKSDGVRSARGRHRPRQRLRRQCLRPCATDPHPERSGQYSRTIEISVNG